MVKIGRGIRGIWQFIVDHLHGCRIATISYTGDGAATQSIVGAGFPPRAIHIYRQALADGDMGWRTDQDGFKSKHADMVTWAFEYRLDMIVTLDPDGFTVGDGTGLANVFNVSGVTYTAILWG